MTSCAGSSRWAHTSPEIPGPDDGDPHQTSWRRRSGRPGRTYLVLIHSPDVLSRSTPPVPPADDVRPRRRCGAAHQSHRRPVSPGSDLVHGTLSVPRRRRSSQNPPLGPSRPSGSAGQPHEGVGALGRSAQDRPGQGPEGGKALLDAGGVDPPGVQGVEGHLGVPPRPLGGEADLGPLRPGVRGGTGIALGPGIEVVHPQRRRRTCPRTTSSARARSMPGAGGGAGG